MLSHHIVDVNNMILLRQAFSQRSSVSTYTPEILPPSIGSMSPKLGLMGWRVYSILPVSGFFLRTSFFERHPSFIMVLNNGSRFGDGGDGVFFHDDYGAVRNGRFHRVTVQAQQVFSFFQFTV